MQQIETAFAERAASEGRLRRFVGDASHELRTPLTSIRGYAELFRRGAADRPEDLAKAMRRIEEEADRMGALVDDMLLLARLDQGRPLEHAAGRPHPHHARRGRRRPRGRSGSTDRFHAGRPDRRSRRRGPAPPDPRQPVAERESPHAARHARARARQRRRGRSRDRGRRRRAGHADRGREPRVRAVLAFRPVAHPLERRRRPRALDRRRDRRRARRAGRGGELARGTARRSASTCRATHPRSTAAYIDGADAAGEIPPIPIAELEDPDALKRS